jgi:DNA-binding CsgD family transcriptional regulator
MTNQRYDEIVYDLYVGVTSQHGWANAVVRLRELMNSAQATFLVHDKLLGKTVVSEQAKDDSQFAADYASGFYEIDPVRPLVARLPLAHWFLDEVHLGRKAIERDDFYQLFLRKFGLGSVMCCSLGNDERYLAGLAFQSGLGEDGFAQEHVERVLPVMPHLLQASRLRLEFRRLSESSKLGQAVLDSIPTPILLINQKADVLFANEAGSRWLEGTTHLFGQRRSVQLERMREEVVQIARRICDRSPSPCVAIALPGGENGAVYLVGLALAESHPISIQFGAPVGLLIVRTSVDEGSNGAAIFRSLFGLTDTEARFTDAFHRTDSVQDAAAAIGVTYQTARSYLKTIFEKTGCHNQASLQHLWTVLTRDLPQ